MRLFFLLLLLMNVAFYIWHEPIVAWMKGDAPVERTVTRSETMPSLVLLSERDAPRSEPAARQDAPAKPPPQAAGLPSPSVQADFPPAAVSSAARAETAAALPAGQCIEVGPYTDAALAAAARSSAESAGMKAGLERVERDMPAGYWLLTEERYNLAGARDILRRMGEDGVDDIAIVSLDSGMAISLGLYSRSAAMERRRRELVELGYPVEVRQRSERREVQVLHLATAAGADAQAVKALLTDLVSAEPRLEWRDTACR